MYWGEYSCNYRKMPLLIVSVLAIAHKYIRSCLVFSLVNEKLRLGVPFVIPRKVTVTITVLCSFVLYCHSPPLASYLPLAVWGQPRTLVPPLSRYFGPLNNLFLPHQRANLTRRVLFTFLPDYVISNDQRSDQFF